MENTNLSTWSQVSQIPQNVSITSFAEYDGKLFAVGGEQNRSDSNSCVKLYLSEDHGVTWKELESIPSELSFASAIAIIGDKIIISGRKGKCQQEWVGAVYSCNLKDILS